VSTFEYLDIDDVMGMIPVLEIGPVRDVGLLDSAVNRPRSSAFGEDAYQTIDLKAAALLHSLTKHHALVDGNERIAWLCTLVFCDLNNYASSITDNEAFDLVREIASSQMEVAAIANRLRLTATITDRLDQEPKDADQE
jgi:death-on-curing protein